MCEVATVYARDERVARKQHCCHECAGVITKGEIYLYHHGIFDGTPFSFKVCSDCEVLHAEVDKGKPMDERTAFGYLADTILFADNVEWMGRFLSIKEKRQATIKPWMIERFDTLTNKADDAILDTLEND